MAVNGLSIKSDLQDHEILLPRTVENRWCNSSGKPLVPGDWVVVIRYPVLAKSSVMVMKYVQCDLPVAGVTPAAIRALKGDFDGDVVYCFMIDSTAEYVAMRDHIPANLPRGEEEAGSWIGSVTAESVGFDPSEFDSAVERIELLGRSTVATDESLSSHLDSYILSGCIRATHIQPYVQASIGSCITCRDRITH